MLAVHLENVVQDLPLLLTAVQVPNSLTCVLSRLDLLFQILTEINELELLVLCFQRCDRDIDLWLIAMRSRSRLAAVVGLVLTYASCLGNGSLLPRDGDGGRGRHSLQVETRTAIKRLLVNQILVICVFLGVALVGGTIYIGEVLVDAQWLLHLLTLDGVLVGGDAVLVSEVGQ